MRLYPRYRKPFRESAVFTYGGLVWPLAILFIPAAVVAQLVEGRTFHLAGTLSVAIIWLVATAAMIRYLRLPVRKDD